MELKKIASIILSFVFIIIAAFSVSAQGNDVLSFGQISVNMPEIRLELKGSGYKTESISATLDTEKLSVKKIETYNSNTCGLAPVACLETENNTCEKKDTCQTLALWEGLKKVINSYLDNVTLEDLANKTESDDCYMYNI